MILQCSFTMWRHSVFTIGFIIDYVSHISFPGHIPNARLINLWDLADKNADYDFTVLPPDEFAKVLRAKGVSNDKPVAVYQRGDVVEQQAGIGTFASRLWWLLTYYGHQNVSIVGGYKLVFMLFVECVQFRILDNYIPLISPISRSFLTPGSHVFQNSNVSKDSKLGLFICLSIIFYQ